MTTPSGSISALTPTHPVPSVNRSDRGWIACAARLGARSGVTISGPRLNADGWRVTIIHGDDSRSFAAPSMRDLVGLVDEAYGP